MKRRRIRSLAGLVLVMSAWSVTPAGAQGTTPAPPPAAEPAMPSIKSLFTKLPSDVRRLPSWTNGAWLGATGLIAFAVHPSDQEITREAVDSPGFEFVLDSGATLGGGLIQGGGAVGTYVIGRLAHRSDIAIVGADLIRAQIIETAMTQSIKLAVNRERPDGSRYSFPSGHTASTFATATVLQQHFGWKVGVPAYAVAAYVGGSRLSENKHFLSDVVFGAGVGIVAGRAVTVGHGANTFTISPMVSRGAVGVTFTKLPSP